MEETILGFIHKTKDFIELSGNEVKEFAIVEHNRWNVEKLLMGFRKPSKEEDHYQYVTRENHPEIRKTLSGNKDLFIHHDIRPFNELNEVKELERQICKYIPWIMGITK